MDWPKLEAAFVQETVKNTRIPLRHHRPLPREGLGTNTLGRGEFTKESPLRPESVSHGTYPLHHLVSPPPFWDGTSICLFRRGLTNAPRIETGNMSRKKERKSHSKVSHEAPVVSERDVYLGGIQCAEGSGLAIYNEKKKRETRTISGVIDGSF